MSCSDAKEFAPYDEDPPAEEKYVYDDKGEKLHLEVIARKDGTGCSVAYDMLGFMHGEKKTIRNLDVTENAITIQQIEIMHYDHGTPNGISYICATDGSREDVAFYDQGEIDPAITQNLKAELLLLQMKEQQGLFAKNPLQCAERRAFNLQRICPDNPCNRLP